MFSPNSLREAAKEGAQEWEVAGAGVAAMQVGRSVGWLILAGWPIGWLVV